MLPNQSQIQSKSVQNKSRLGMKTHSNFPTIDNNQSSTFYTRNTNNNSTTNHIEKRVPRSILKELSQTDSDFFLTIYDNNTKARRNNNSEQIKLKPLQVKKQEKKIDSIIQSVDKAVEKLRLNMKPEKRQINNFSDSDSDNDGMLAPSSPTSRKKKNMQQSKVGLNKGKSMKGLPDPDKMLGQYASQIKRQSQMGGVEDPNLKKKTKSIAYDNRQQQINSMQETLGEGLQKYNNIVREVEQRQQKLKQLIKLIQDTDNELSKMRQFDDIINGNNGTLLSSIKKQENEIIEQKYKKETLKHMKSVKRKDLDLIKKRCEEIKEKNVEFDRFLQKETQTLVYDAKKLDEIRTQYQEVAQNKEIVEQRLEKALKEQAKIMKDEEEVLQVIYQEQAAQDELDNLKKSEQAEKKLKKQNNQDKIKNKIDVEKKKLLNLEEEFYKLKSQLNGINTLQDLLPQLQDLKETNSFCIQKKQRTVDEMNELRKNIQEHQQMLHQSKCESVSIPTDDQLVQQYEDTTINKTQQEYDQLLEETQKIKESEIFLQKSLTQSERGLKNLISTLQHTGIPELKSVVDIEKKNLQEVSIEVIKGLRALMEKLEENNIDETKIEEFLFEKYKEYDVEEDSQEDFNDIEDNEDFNSESSDNQQQSQQN